MIEGLANGSKAINEDSTRQSNVIANDLNYCRILPQDTGGGPWDPKNKNIAAMQANTGTSLYAIKYFSPALPPLHSFLSLQTSYLSSTIHKKERGHQQFQHYVFNTGDATLRRWPGSLRYLSGGQVQVTPVVLGTAIRHVNCNSRPYGHAHCHHVFEEINS